MWRESTSNQLKTQGAERIVLWVTHKPPFSWGRCGTMSTQSGLTGSSGGSWIILLISPVLVGVVADVFLLIIFRESTAWPVILMPSQT